MLSENLDDHEVCAVCGKDADGEHWFCHFYQDGSRITLCSPKCADAYLHRSDVPNFVDAPPTWSSVDVAHVGT